MNDMPNENPAFPMPPPAFDGASRRVEPGACFDWLRQGWALFADNPALWLACALIVLLVVLGLNIVPVVGHLAANLLLPVLGAGLYHLCRRQASDEEPHLSDLFAGFKHESGKLVMLGVWFMLAMLLIALVSAVVVGSAMIGGGGGAVGFGVMLGSFLLSILLALALGTPVFMALWFAPALVFFHGLAPLAAMQASFRACLKNWLAFGVYGVILFVLFFFSALPLGLGFLLLIPVTAGAMYASYRDVFVGV